MSVVRPRTSALRDRLRRDPGRAPLAPLGPLRPTLSSSPPRDGRAFDADDTADSASVSSRGGKAGLDVLRLGSGVSGASAALFDDLLRLDTPNQGSGASVSSLGSRLPKSERFAEGYARSGLEAAPPAEQGAVPAEFVCVAAGLFCLLAFTYVAQYLVRHGYVEAPRHGAA